MLAGFDGAMAAAALGKLRAAEAVGDLRDVLFHETPAMAAFVRLPRAAARRPIPSNHWTCGPGPSIISDFRMWFAILPALAEIGSEEALAALDAIIDAAGEGIGRDASVSARASGRGVNELSMARLRLDLRAAPGPPSTRKCDGPRFSPV